MIRLILVEHEHIHDLKKKDAVQARDSHSFRCSFGRSPTSTTL